MPLDPINQTMSPAQALAALERRLGKYRQSGAFYNFHCPFKHPEPHTQDTKYRFGVNLATGWYTCFRCQRKGLIEDAFGIVVKGAGGTPQARLVPRTPLNALAPSERPIEPFRVVPPEGDGGPLCKPVLAYLASRGIDQITAHALGIGYGNESPWYNQAIHPYYEDDDTTLAGWQGRVIHPAPGSPKVFTAKKEQWPSAMGAKEGALYLLECTREEEPVVITEGPYDALSVSRILPAVAVLGSVLHPAQARRLLRRKPSEIIVGFDSDKDSDARKAARLLKREWQGTVRLVRWPKDWDPDLDFGAMSSDQVREVLMAEWSGPFRVGE